MRLTELWRAEGVVVVWDFASDDPIRALAERAAFTSALESIAGAAVDSFTAAIVFAELVGNVVRHAPGPITITLAFDELVVVLTVCDQGAAFVFNPILPAELSESGRGMFLISQFANEVSVSRDGEAGNAVRAVFALR
jgi:anti-sigma regulatory factor (Ser/Thr protein kinase)